MIWDNEVSDESLGYIVSPNTCYFLWIFTVPASYMIMMFWWIVDCPDWTLLSRSNVAGTNMIIIGWFWVWDVRMGAYLDQVHVIHFASLMCCTRMAEYLVLFCKLKDAGPELSVLSAVTCTWHWISPSFFWVTNDIHGLNPLPYSGLLYYKNKQLRL
jgi:hypothetical protein